MNAADSPPVLPVLPDPFVPPAHPGPEIDPAATGVHLDAGTRTDLGVKRVLRGLLDAWLAAEPGVREELDPEYLHELRVAVRRTRSGLGQIKGIFPPEAVERFRAELAWLGEITGPKRDLDVYRMMVPDFRLELPAELQTSLEPFDAFLAAHQAIEQAKLVAALDSERYRRLVEDWRSFLADPAPSPDDLPNAARAVEDTAAERIWRAYRRVRDHGRLIRPDTPAEAVHRLRIEGKKLRYLMEFFQSLYRPAKMQRLIAAQKQLQENLGDFNDAVVQHAALATLADAMHAEGLGTAATYMALGRLQTHLEATQAERRHAFAKRFRAFDGKTNRRRFRRLFKPRVAASTH